MVPTALGMGLVCSWGRAGKSTWKSPSREARVVQVEDFAGLMQERARSGIAAKKEGAADVERAAFDGYQECRKTPGLERLVQYELARLNPQRDVARRSWLGRPA